MHHYNCLIYAHYRREPAALAIIRGGHKKEERFYSHNRYGTESIYRYNNIVLTELDDEELLKSDNPLDLALYAAKLESQSKDEPQKAGYLRKVVRLLVDRGWDWEKTRDLLLFIERILSLKDKKLVRQYKEYRQQLVEEGKIMYIPFYEKEEAEEVERRGMEKGKEEMAKNLLANGVPPDIIARSAGLPLDKIQSMVN
jgi:predicted transposase/invertase (TIGR01784 family)